MKALLRKELLPFLAPAILGMVLFTCLWLAVFDVESAFLASPDRMLVAVLILALNLGAFLGYVQLAVERDGTTFSYLVHRDVPLGRLLAAKCVAGWTMLALVVLAPVLLRALVARSFDPFGAVLQWSRVGEIAIAGLAFLPAHALGMFVASLRPAFPWRVTFGSFALGGLGGATAFFLERPIAGPAASRVLFVAGCIAVAAVFLAAARRSAERMQDAERAPSPALLATILAAFALLIVAPGHNVVGLVQAEVLRAGAQDAQGARDQPSLVWHAELGPARVTLEREGMIARGPDGEHIAQLSMDPTSVPASIDDGWIGVWKPNGRLAEQLWPELRSTASRRGTPCIADEWTGLETGRVTVTRTSDVEAFSVTCFHDRTHGRFLVLRREVSPEGRSDVASRVEVLRRSGAASLRALVRGDGRPFAPGAVASTQDEELSVDDPSDGTTWSCDWLKPGATFRRVGEGRYRQALASAEPRIVGRYCPGGWTYADAPIDAEAPLAWPPADARVRADVDGDLLASTVRIVDAQTGATLLQQRYGPDGPLGIALTAFVYAAELLRAPLAVVGVHLFQDPHAAWPAEPPLAGWLTGAGRRPLLVLANVALAAFLALRARRELVRRGAAAWRRRTWTLAVLCLGVPAVLAYLLAEPSPISISRATARGARAARPLLLRTSEVGA